MDNQTKYLVKTIPGKLYLGEPSLLWKFGRKCQGKGVILEIGSWKGKSTMLLARGSKTNSKSKVYAVDTFKGTKENSNKIINTLPDFKENMKKANIENLVTPLVGFSTNVAKTFTEPIEILFIDGDHTYEGVIADIKDWEPKLIKGGWILFHDTSSKSVMKAVKEKIINSKDYSKIGFNGSIIFAKKYPSTFLEKSLKKHFIIPLRTLLIDLWKNIPESVKRMLRKKRNLGG